LIRVLIVDDESLARIRLQRLLEKIEGVEIVGQAANGADAVALAGECLPDIVLMDIRMPVLDGIQAAERISAMTPPPAVIFCTAFDDFALRAFDAQASAYLLKPVNAEDLAQAIKRAARLTRAQLNQSSNGGRRHLCCRTHQGVDLIEVDKVILFQAEEKYVTAVLADRQAILSETLKELEAEFGTLFIRVNRSVLVARAAVDGLVKKAGRSAVIVHGLNQRPVVSRRQESKWRQLLTEL